MMPYLVSRCFSTLSRAALARAGLDADTRHHAHALGFNVYFPFFADTASHRSGEGIIGADEPFSVPAGIQNDLFMSSTRSWTSSASSESPLCRHMSAYSSPYLTNMPAMKTLSATGPRWGPVVWKALSGSCGEAIQIQAVIPVGAADLGQSVGSPVVGRIPEPPAEVLHQGCLVGVTGIKGTHFIQDAEVAGLLDIGGGRRDQPEGVIVIKAADGIAPRGEGLIPVISASVLELGIGDINDTLSRPSPGSGGQNQGDPGRNHGIPFPFPVRSHNSWRPWLTQKVTMHRY